MIRKQYIPYTTSAGGAATVYNDGSSLPNRAIVGVLKAVHYLPGTTDTGATVTVTCEGAYSHTLVAKATAGTANTFFHPRELTHNPADGATLTGTAGGDRAEPVLDGYLKVVIASGGNTTSGAVIVYYDESL